jgi:hypothetical protein
MFTQGSEKVEAAARGRPAQIYLRIEIAVSVAMCFLISLKARKF